MGYKSIAVIRKVSSAESCLLKIISYSWASMQCLIGLQANPIKFLNPINEDKNIVDT